MIYVLSHANKLSKSCGSMASGQFWTIYFTYNEDHHIEKLLRVTSRHG